MVARETVKFSEVPSIDTTRERGKETQKIEDEPLSPASPGYIDSSPPSSRGEKRDSQRMTVWGDKITELSDTLLGLHAGIDDERNDRFEKLQAKIRGLDDRLAAWQNAGAKEFSSVKDQLLLFQDELDGERHKREALCARKAAEIAQLDKELKGALEAEQNNLRQTESRILQVFDNKTNGLEDEMSRMGRAAGDNLANLRRYLEEDVPRLYSMLREETQSREVMEREMLATAMEEVRELQEVIVAEKRAREDTEEVMLRMMEDAVAKMQGELVNERRERKQTEQMLLNLLHETCDKLHVTSKSL